MLVPQPAFLILINITFQSGDNEPPNLEDLEGLHESVVDGSDDEDIEELVSKILFS